MSDLQNAINKLNRLKWSHVFLIGLALGGGFLLVDQFQSQLGSFLPYLILLLCPLMHVFLHRGHGGHGGHGSHEERRSGEGQRHLE